MELVRDFETYSKEVADEKGGAASNCSKCFTLMIIRQAAENQLLVIFISVLQNFSAMRLLQRLHYLLADAV